MSDFPPILPSVITRAESATFTAHHLLSDFVAAANKQRRIDLPHHVWCNSPRANGSGYGRCNCGVADLLSCLRAYESRDNWEETA